METAIDGGAARPAAASVGVVAAVPALVGALLGLALFFGGGHSDGPLFWLGTLAAAAAALAVGASALGFLPWPSLEPAGLAFLGLLAGLVAWSGLSIAWSTEPARTWDYLNRELVYLAFAVLGLYAGALARRGSRELAAGLAALLALVLGWALLGKVVPSLAPGGARVARLNAPIGYWNALALLADSAVVLGLWVASRARETKGRVAGGLLVYVALAALFLTYSRGGVVLAAVGVLVWLWLGGRAFEAVAALALAAPAAGIAFGVAYSLPGVTRAGEPEHVRAHDGRLFALAFLAGAAAVGAGAAFGSRREVGPAARRRFVRAAAIAAAAAAAAVVLLGLVRAGGPVGWVHAFTRPQQVEQTPGRFASFSSNNRWTWWQESARAWADAPLQGHGAGTFRRLHTPRSTQDSVIEPHDLPLQFLAETGLVGLLLALGAVVAAALAVRATLRRLEGGERAAAAALAVCALLYGLHALVEYDWDFVALSAPLFVALGALAAGPPRATPPPARRGGLLWAAGALVLALGVVYSLAAPWLSDRRVADAVAAVGRGDLAGSVARAKEARALNPLATEPLLVWAEDEAALDTPRSRGVARRLYLDATERDPRDADTWYFLGLFELQTLHAPRAAYTHLNHSYTLNPFGPAASPCGPLDQARAAIEHRKLRCRRRARGARP